MTDLVYAALSRIQAAIAKHLHPSAAMSKDQFIDEVLAAADDKEVVRTMREEATPYGPALVVDETVIGPEAEAFLADLDEQVVDIEKRPRIT